MKWYRRVAIGLGGVFCAYVAFSAGNPTLLYHVYVPYPWQIEVCRFITALLAIFLIHRAIKALKEEENDNN